MGCVMMQELIVGILFGIALTIFATVLFITWLKYSLDKENSDSRRKF